MIRQEILPGTATVARTAENAFAVALLSVMTLLPVLEIGLRTFFGLGILGAIAYVQNLALWVGFVGAMIAAREARHLGLSAGLAQLELRYQWILKAFSTAVSTAVTAGLFWACFDFVRAEMKSPETIGGSLPIWVAESILPLAFAVITVRVVTQAEDRASRLAALLGVIVCLAISAVPQTFAPSLVWPVIGILFLALLSGATIFVVLGGAALMLFFADGVPVAAIPVETYRIVTSPTTPAIPLFTLTGYLLAEGRASERLVRLFRALVGWLPGGMAIVTTLVCAFFATFTGASGVTILALGGLLLPILLKSGYRKRFSLGLLTSTGSIGLLFPPSLAVILYGVVAHVPIPDLFLAGIVPGILMVIAISLLALREGLLAETSRLPFDGNEALSAAWGAKWELLLPVVVLVGIFGGIMTLVEAAALSAVYTILVEAMIHRDLSLSRDLPRAFVKCATLVGAVFIILGMALGLTNFLVDAQVPMKAATWVKAHIESPLLFLLALNVFLLVVGCLMDIFSAIVVIVPLLLPIGTAFGIHPLHLAMIFLVNLELGYMTPPVGMNLFLASIRFEKHLVEVYRSTLPFLFTLLVVLILVTYFPGITLFFVAD